MSNTKRPKTVNVFGGQGLPAVSAPMLPTILEVERDREETQFDKIGRALRSRDNPFNEEYVKPDERPGTEILGNSFKVEE